MENPHRFRSLLLAVASALLLVSVAGACSDDDHAAPRVESATTTTTHAPTTKSPKTDPPNPGDCGLFSTELPGSAQLCDLREEIGDGSIEVAAGADFCLAVADAPPELVAIDFFGRTDVVAELQDYFTRLAPIAPPALKETTQILADNAGVYLEILQRRDAGEITADEAEAEFAAILAPIDAAHPRLIPTWLVDAVGACVPVES